MIAWHRATSANRTARRYIGLARNGTLPEPKLEELRQPA
jgi:hypothetical protein